jgi:hypothetical protein
MAKTKKIPSTQGHLDVDDVRDDLIILKNGNAAAVLQAGALNFDLLSESEQDALIFAFAGLVNSLTFPIQVLVRSKRVDVTNYLFKLEEAKKAAHNPALASQIETYEFFIRDLVSKNQVLDKRFYIIIPYLGLDLSQLKNLGGLFGPRKPILNKWQVLEKARVNLEPKVAHLVDQLGRLGIKSARLTTAELVELLYDLYNPELAREQKAAMGPAEYTTPIVEPAVAPLVSNEQGVKEGEK